MWDICYPTSHLKEQGGVGEALDELQCSLKSEKMKMFKVGTLQLNVFVDIQGIISRLHVCVC